MTRRLKAGIGAAALVAAAGGAGLGMVTATARASTAAPHAKSHTQTVVSRDEKEIRLGKSGKYVDFSKDIEHGKVIGADSSSGSYNAKTGIVSADFSVLRKGGLLYGRFTLDTHSLKISGKVLGGLGRYKGVTGTVKGHAVNDKDSKVTLTYHD